MKDIPSPENIYKELSKYVIGQDDAKKSLSIVAYNHLLRYKRNVCPTYMECPPRLTLLILGPSGSGKTSLATGLGSYLHIPFYAIDATTLACINGEGEDIQDHLRNYYHTFKNKDNYNYGIIYIDEIDKIFKYDSKDNSHNSIYMNAVVHSLLSVIDGVNHKVPDLDVSKLLFVLSGAFEYIAKDKISVSKPIGYKTVIVEDKKEITRTDLEEYSAIPRELLGRINVITQTYPLNEVEVRDVLTNCYNAVIPQFESTFILGGSNLKLSDSEFDDIVKEVQKSPYGMRIAKSVLFDKLKDKLYKLGA